MLRSNVFDYINVLDKAADASWLRNEAIANNIANVDTPYYKRQDVSFETELKKALGSNRFESMDEKVSRIDTATLNPQPYTDYAGFSYRLDHNNVDIDQEEAYLAENQIRYQALVDQMVQEFGRYKTVLS